MGSLLAWEEGEVEYNFMADSFPYSHNFATFECVVPVNYVVSAAYMSVRQGWTREQLSCPACQQSKLTVIQSI